MTVEEIKSSVMRGNRVCWSHEGYQVVRDRIGQWLIKCLANNSCIGLTWADETTLNGKPSEFFIAMPEKAI